MRYKTCILIASVLATALLLGTTAAWAQEYGNYVTVRGLEGKGFLQPADDGQLQSRLFVHADHLRDRVVKVGVLAGMNVRAFLNRVELVHVKRGERGRLVSAEINRRTDA